MSNKPGNLLKPTLIRNFSSSKISSNATRYLPLMTNAQRTARQAKLVHSSRSNGSRRMTKESIRLPSEVPIALPEYHSWQKEFQPIFTRDRLLRPMTKDPYHQNQRRLANAVETKATEEECCPVLISPAEVQVHKPTIHHSSSGRSPTQTVRFADDARPVSLAKPIGQQSKSPAPAIHQSSKTYGTAPVLATEARLLNRAKMRDDVLVIRRPPRRLTIHITHETLLPLAVCG